MFRRASLVLLCCIFVVDGAIADRDIVLLAGNASKVVISDEYGTIHITDGDPATFVFECFDDVTHDPGDIEDIGLSGTPSGTITVSILAGPGHTFGAQQVKKIDLTGTGVTGTLAELNISSHLGQVGGVTVDGVSGNVQIGGNLLNTFDAGAVNGTLDIGGDVVNTITTTSWSNTSSLLIGGNVDSDITLAGNLGALLEVGGNIAAHLQIDGNMLGQHQTYINVYGQLTTGGHLEITGDALNGANDDEHSWIKIGQMTAGARRMSPIVVILRNWAYPRVSVMG